jgi:hypothetical protein
MVVRAPADGYTLLTVGATNARARFADLGASVFPGSPADFGKLIADENREVGQGDPGGQHQGGMNLIATNGRCPARPERSSPRHRFRPCVQKADAEKWWPIIKELGIKPD